MANLDSRIRALEAAAAPKLVYVVTIRADGTEVRLKPGERYSRHVLELPFRDHLASRCRRSLQQRYFGRDRDRFANLTDFQPDVERDALIRRDLDPVADVALESLRFGVDPIKPRR